MTLLILAGGAVALWYVVSSVQKSVADSAKVVADAPVHAVQGVTDAAQAVAEGATDTARSYWNFLTLDDWASVQRGTSVLKMGSKGPAVLTLQKKLIWAGAKMKADGAFGGTTASWLSRFQLRNRKQIAKAEARGVYVGTTTAAALDRKLRL